MSYWPWWAGAIALATIATGYLLVIGRLLGVSGAVSRVLRREEPLPEDLAEVEAALLAATRAQFGDSAVEEAEAALAPPARAKPLARPLDWLGNLALLAGIVGGGAIGAATRGAWHARKDFGPEFAHAVGGGWRALVALFVGGALVGVGTAMAGGCTSGHGLCGTARLQRGSLVATVCFFGAAVAISLAWQALTR